MLNLIPLCASVHLLLSFLYRSFCLCYTLVFQWTAFVFVRIRRR